MPVYKDKKRNTWYVSTYVTDKLGNKKRVLKRGFKTKTEAKSAESDIIFNASLESLDNPIINDLLDDYMEWYRKRRKPSTINKLEGTIKLYIRPFFGDKYIKSVTKRDIVKFHDHLLDKLAVTTSKAVHKDLSAMFNYAVRMEYIAVNPAKEAGNIDIKEDRNVNYWTLEEFKHFLTVVDNERYYAFFMLLFYSGARIGEVLALTWKDIDFKNNTININKRYYNTEIDTPKNESSIRIVKLPNHTINLIRKLKLKGTFKEDYFIFGSFYKPLNQSTVNQQYYKYLDRLGEKFKKIRLHDFRHSHASYLINKGYDIQIVSKRLGHNKVSTTLDIYAHLYPNKEDDAVLEMENDFKPAQIVSLPK